MDHGSLPRALANVRGANLAGDSNSNSIEPVAKQVRPAQRRSLPHEDKKGRLECVVDVLLTPEDTPADARDHAPVPPHDRRKCAGIPARHVIAQQALVGRFALTIRAGNVLHGSFNVRETPPSMADLHLHTARRGMRDCILARQVLNCLNHGKLATVEYP